MLDSSIGGSTTNTRNQVNALPLALPCLALLWAIFMTEDLSLRPVQSRNDDTSSLYAFLSRANRMHSAVDFFDQSLTSSVHYLLGLPCVLLPSLRP